MQAKQIEQLRNFEKIVKEKIIAIYSAYLTNETKDSLQKESLIKDDYENTFISPENIQGEIIRLVFSKIFEKIPCTKKIKFSDGEKKNICYGNNIFNGLISYYSKDFSNKTNIKIDEISNYLENEKTIIELKDKMNILFDTMAFNTDAVTLLNASNCENIIKLCDKKAVLEFIKQKNTKNNTHKCIEKVFPIVYFDSVQYIKYVDCNKEEHLIKVKNPKEVSKIYKSLLEKQQEQNILVEDIFCEFTKIGEHIPFYTKNIDTKSKLLHSEKDLLDTFYGKKEELYGEEPIETKKISSNSSIRLITEEEYEKLCMKSVNNRKITEEELALMEYFDSYYFGNGQTNNIKIDNSQKSETKENNNIKNPQVVPQGYAQKYTPIFALIVILLLGILFGFIVYNYLNF